MCHGFSVWARAGLCIQVKQVHTRQKHVYLCIGVFRTRRAAVCRIFDGRIRCVKLVVRTTGCHLFWPWTGNGDGDHTGVAREHLRGLGITVDNLLDLMSRSSGYLAWSEFTFDRLPPGSYQVMWVFLLLRIVGYAKHLWVNRVFESCSDSSRSGRRGMWWRIQGGGHRPNATRCVAVFLTVHQRWYKQLYWWIFCRSVVWWWSGQRCSCADGCRNAEWRSITVTSWWACDDAHRYAGLFSWSYHVLTKPVSSVICSLF